MLINLFQLKANCLVVQKLRELSGFGWDESKNIVVATDKVWDDYLEVSDLSLTVNYALMHHLGPP